MEDQRWQETLLKTLQETLPAMLQASRKHVLANTFGRHV